MRRPANLLSTFLAWMPFTRSQHRHTLLSPYYTSGMQPGQDGQMIKVGWQKHRSRWETPVPDWEGAGDQGRLPGGGATYTKS